MFGAMCLLRGAKKSNHHFCQWKVVLQTTEKTHTGPKASLYSSIPTKGAEWVFENDGQGKGGRGRDISEMLCLRAELCKGDGKTDH